MNKKRDEEQFEIKIVVDESVAQGIYVNFLSVLHNQAEFVMDFGRLVPGRQDVKIQARLISNPIAFKQIVKTLNENLERYETHFGVISADMPPPKGIVQ
ncbi:MAG: DUF3467 domain-containing protein [Acidobacteria bacterium]|nr:DUF3467 domain-containing protein [Acidobacteriota bacterium]